MQLPSCKKKIRPGGVYPLSSLFTASALTLSQTLFCEGYIEDVTLRKTKHLPLISMAWFLWSPSTGVITVCSAVYIAITVIWDFYQPFFLRTIENIFTVKTASGLPSYQPPEEEVEQTPSLCIERKHEAWIGQGLLHGSISLQDKELWRVLTFHFQSAGGQRFDCFSNLYSFLLSHRNVSGLGNSFSLL